MKKLFLFLCLSLLFTSCGKDEEVKRELLISAHGTLRGGKYTELSSSEGINKDGYWVYLHKGKIEITDEKLKNPAAGAYERSRGVFLKVVDDGEYTVIVTVSYLHDGAFGSSYYSGVAYTTVKYPQPDLGKTFQFNWDKDVSNYEEGGIIYTNLK